MLANFGRRPARDSCEPEVEAAQGVVRAQGEGQALGAGGAEGVVPQVQALEGRVDLGRSGSNCKVSNSLQI